MNSRHLFVLTLLASLCPAPLALQRAAAAQTSSPVQETGTISGRVRNEATGAYLEGANVVLQPLGRTTLTSRDGSFTFSRLPPQRYELLVSHTGTDSKTVDVVVAAGATATPEIALTAGIYQLETFVVAGEREGSALAAQLQRNAPNVKNVLSADTFGSVADENIGNFLLRVPGITGDAPEGNVNFIRIRGVDPNMNAVTVDGTRTASGGTQGGLGRAFEIDKFPASLIDSIEVTKAPTPDMDADSIGGSVNLKTKSAFNQKGLLATYKIGNSYNTGRKTFRPTASFMVSDTVGREQRLGVIFTASFNSNSNPRDTIFGAWEGTLATDRPAYYTLSSAGEDYFENKRGGAGLRFDYRWSANTTVYVNLMYSGNHDRLFRRRNAFAGFTGVVFDHFDAAGVPRSATNQVATLLPGWTYTVTETINQTFQFTQFDRTRDQNGYNVHLGGDRRFATAKLDFNLNFSTSRGIEDRVNLTPTVTGVGFRFNRDLPDPDNPAGATFQQISGPDITNAANFNFPSVGFNHDLKKETIWGGQLNFKQTLPTSLPVYVQTGLRFRIQDPEQFFTRPSYNYVGPRGAALARFVDQSYTYQPKALRGTMPSTRFFHIPTVLYELENTPSSFTLDRVVTLRNELINDRNASEAVYAAYVMAGAQLRRLNVLAGLRAEETHVQGIGSFQAISTEERARRLAWVGTVTEAENLRRTQAEYGNRRSNRSDYRNVFPGLHFKYDVSAGLLARASYSTGIGRPNFTTIIPNDSVNDAAQRVTANNTSLRPQRSDNFDVTLEYYFKPAGMFTVGAFMKEIDDFIFMTDRGLIAAGADNGFGGDYAGYTLTTQANGGSARIRGVEVSYQQQFSKLPGFWRGFGVYANHTWLQTEGDYGTVGTTVQTGQVPGFIPQSGNLGLSYIQRGWTLRAQYNYNSRALGNTLNANVALRQYNYSKRRVDFNAAYALSPKLTLFVDVINALSDTLGDNPYIYIPERKRGADLFTAEVKFGVSGRF
ncbi:MAG: TonB-dependent receptor [Verrucomicrobiota bacterium]